MPRPNPYFRLNVQDDIDVIELLLPGEVDVAAFHEISRGLIDQWPFEPDARIVVDLTTCQYIGSVLLGLLINLRQKANASGGALVVGGASARLTQTMKTARLERLIPLYGSRAAAIAAV